MIGIGIGIGLSRGYGGPRASLALDFIAQNYRPSGFGSGMTFTRAGTATFIDAAGAMQVAAADQPRLNHDPVTLAPLGILIEGATTNYVLRSADLSVAPWVSNAGVTRTGGQPDAFGGTAATRVVFSAANLISCSQGIVAPASGLMTFSAFIKGTAGQTIRCRMGSPSEFTHVLTGGWDLLSRTFAVTAGAEVQINISTWVGATARDVMICLPQAEYGATRSSYIPTAAALVTRAADSLQVALGAWWPGAASGTIMAEFDCPPVAQSAAMAYFNSTSFNNSIGLSKVNALNTADGTHLVGSMYDTASALSVPLDLGLTSGPHRAAMSWGGGTMQAVANGVAGPEVAQRSPAPSKLWLGQRDGTALHLNGHLRRVLYYPRRLTAAQMQTLTT